MVGKDINGMKVHDSAARPKIGCLLWGTSPRSAAVIVDNNEEAFKELEYAHDVRYRIFKLASRLATRGVEVVSGKQRVWLEI